MLILTRNSGQTLKIGDDVEVCVLGVNGAQVRIGVNAPKEVPVHREEIYQRIQDEKGSGAATPSPGDESQACSGHIADLKELQSYGFIYVPGLPNNVFFHASDVKDGLFDQLEEGAKVVFRLKKSNRGPVAVDVAVEE